MQTTAVAKSFHAVVARAWQEGVAAAAEHAVLLAYSVAVDDHPGHFFMHSGGESTHWHYFEAGANDDQAITHVQVTLE